MCANPGGQRVGFTRVLTDRVFKALVFDERLAHAHRNAGLGRALIDHVLKHPMVAQVRHIALYCKPEMIPFFEQWGFAAPGRDVNFPRKTRDGASPAPSRKAD